jgi:hypothetical protein
VPAQTAATGARLGTEPRVRNAETVPSGAKPDAVITGAPGIALTVTFALFVAEQPEALVTVSVSTVGLDALVPAVQVMFWMLVALVMVPLVIDQAHVVAAGPLAGLPVESSQTCEATVIAGVAGFALMVTLAVFEAEQPLVVTVSESWTVPEAPAV